MPQTPDKLWLIQNKPRSLEIAGGRGGRSNQNTSYNNNVACFTRWDLGDYFNTCTFELEMFKEQLQHENWNTVQMNLPKLDSRISATFGNFRGSKEIFQRGSRYTKYSFLQFCLGLLRLNWRLVAAPVDVTWTCFVLTIGWSLLARPGIGSDFQLPHNLAT